jgi:uncharacterized Zn ribbon protein
MAACFICKTEATDPANGEPSPWRRAIVDDEQVLVCPDCQRAQPDWIERAEGCPVCASKRLYKSIGEKVCRACGHQWSNEPLEL